MKKFALLLVLGALCLSLGACAGESAAAATTEPTEETTTGATFAWDAGLPSSGVGCAMEEPQVQE